jgi:hypothetical protein
MAQRPIIEFGLDRGYGTDDEQLTLPEMADYIAYHINHNIPHPRNPHIHLPFLPVDDDFKPPRRSKRKREGKKEEEVTVLRRSTRNARL